METYYYAPSDQGQRLAALLNEEVEKAGGLLNRGVKTANFYVIKHTNVPASLIELGFVTNEREEQLLNSESYQTTLAEAIARAIARYFS
jgi:N-acetylmuramoyl-L-alanine amidase